jgi:hypothetical protein
MVNGLIASIEAGSQLAVAGDMARLLEAVSDNILQLRVGRGGSRQWYTLALDKQGTEEGNGGNAVRTGLVRHQKIWHQAAMGDVLSLEAAALARRELACCICIDSLGDMSDP